MTSDAETSARRETARGLALKRQILGSKEPSQAWQVMGASLRVEAATRMVRPQGQIAAMRLVSRLREVAAVSSALRHTVMAAVSTATPSA